MICETTIAPLDLDLTLSCGQTFRWRRAGDSWQGVLGNHVVTLRQRGRVLEIDTDLDGRRAVAMVKEHLRAGDDIPRIQRSLSKDPVLARGVRRARGLRIVKMDEWECLVSFVLATYANIPRITKMVEALCSRFGKEIVSGVHAFPDIRRLGQASVEELEGCGLGYRAKYLTDLCSYTSSRDIRRMTRMSFEDLREELLELPGVGNKVADCVALFGFGRLEAFPIDVWMERSLARLYGVKGNYGKLRAFASERFGDYAGYAQEYLYYNERLCVPRGSCMFSDV